MMDSQDAIDKLLESRLLTEKSIVEAVDEYSLYCFYLGFEPELRTSYSCPFRTDDIPSWSLFETKFTDAVCEYRWKDSARSISGDVFTLVQRLYDLPSRNHAIRHIAEQYRRGFSDGEKIEQQGKITLHKKPIDHGTTNISVRSVLWSKLALDFWARYGILPDTLDLYQVCQVGLISLYRENDQPTTIYPKGLCFAYRVADRYKLYQPYDSLYKFRNNYTDRMIEGFFQLSYQSDTLIITKSLKDVMVLHTLGYEAVSARSESTRIPEEYIKYFEKRYSRIIILFDNDGKHNGHLYSHPKVFIPVTSGAKDISDYRKLYGWEEARKLIENLLNE